MIVLDTHAWIRWLHPELGQGLPPILREWLESVDAPFAVSIISCLEVSQLVKKKRLELPMPLPQWFDAALQDSDVTCLSLSPGLIHASTQLPDIHLDPADRIIIATAQGHGAYLVPATRTSGNTQISKPSGTTLQKYRVRSWESGHAFGVH